MDTKTKEKVSNVFGVIDTVMAITQFGSSSISNPNAQANIGVNPFDVVFSLLDRIGVTEEDMADFVAKYLSVAMPALELGVKALLLAQLKEIVSCWEDVRIPAKYRIPYNVSDVNLDKYGVKIDVDTIDIKNKLRKVSPKLPHSTGNYFGIRDGDSIYKLARAEDFDAFLWFVMHKSHFVPLIPANNLTTIGDSFGFESGNRRITSGFYTTAKDKSKGHTMQEGDAFEITNGIVGLCMQVDYSEGKANAGYVLPVSFNSKSANWYTNSRYFYGMNMGLGRNQLWEKPSNVSSDFSTDGDDIVCVDKGRNYTKEFPLFNVEYLEGNGKIAPDANNWNGTFRICIPPMPRVVIKKGGYNKETDEFELPLLKFERFNGDGVYDKNGGYCAYEGVHGSIDDVVRGNNPKGLYADIDKLYPCYTGRTFYEFNYDYIMSLKLFDAREIVEGVFEALKTVPFNLQLNIGFHEYDYEIEKKIDKIITKILESDDSVSSNCYFTFSNEEVDEMLREAEDKRKARHPFGETKNKQVDLTEAYNILKGYSDTATLVEQQETLKRAITSAAVEWGTTENDPERRGDGISSIFGLMDFFKYFIKLLTRALVNAILTPKLLMIIEFNQQVTGQKYDGEVNLERLLSKIGPLLTNMVRMVVDSLMQELLQIILKYLGKIIAVAAKFVFEEVIGTYVKILRMIIEAYTMFDWSFLEATKLNTYITNVEYADIDVPDAPIIKGNC